MAWELIYTSAPRGLRAGTSGYCTVAQTVGLREDLAAALERKSQFAHEGREDSPTYFSYRNLSVGGISWRVMSRACDAGLDFTGRRHFLTHHLVLDSVEDTNGTTPAEILLGWKGWQQTWSRPPEALAMVALRDVLRGLTRVGLPAEEWKRITGDAGWAAAPLEMASPVAWVTAALNSPDLLRLIAESAAILEISQCGKSWLLPFDVGGAANPVPSDCLWTGRTHWRSPGSPAGVRSIICVEACREKLAEGPIEEMTWARLGRGNAKAKRKNGDGVLEDRRLPEERHLEPKLDPDPRPRWAWFLWTLLALLVITGVILWRWPKSWIGHVSLEPSKAGKPAEVVPSQLESRKMAGGPHPVPAVSAGEDLREILWQEAGGKEKIERLQLLYGENTPRVIENELNHFGEESSTVGQIRGPEGEVIVLGDSEKCKKLARDLAPRRQPWSLYVPGKRRGLAYLPDLAVGTTSRILSAQGQSPARILEEIGRNLFIDPKEWELCIQFPSLGNQNFIPISVVYGDEEKLWIEVVAQHRTHLHQLRQVALSRLEPWLGRDAAKLDSREISELIQNMRGAEHLSPLFREFLERDAEDRRWQALFVMDSSPGDLFRRLLEVPGVQCVLFLEKLAVGRVLP